MTGRIYLDHAATTAIAPEAAAAIADGVARWANPSSPHAEGRAARAALEEARARITSALGWRHALIFTSGATEAAALALRRTKRPVIVSAVEHAAVLGARVDAAIAPMGADALVDAAELEDMLAAREGALVAIQHVNSETGVLQPIGALTELVDTAGGLSFADCAQSAGKIPLPHADLIAISAHKLGGPPGIGALLVRDLRMIEPWGQGQEQGYRPGTENLPAVLGFAAAVEALARSDDGAASIRAPLDPGLRRGTSEPVAEWMIERYRWRVTLDAAIRDEGGIVIADYALKSSLIASYAMPGMSAAAQVMRFDALGFAVSAGSACSSGTMRTSRVLAAIGVEEDVAARTIRVSFGRTTRQAEVEAFAAAWIALAREAKARAA